MQWKTRAGRRGRRLAGRAGVAGLFACLCLLWVTAAADIGPETRWNGPQRVVLDVKFPGDGYRANWELFRCACGDLLVRSDLNTPGEEARGETLLVGGRAVLSRGFGEHEAELGSSLDAPALMMQLALRLLERAAPGGPASVGEPMEVDVTDEINHINLDTGTAVGGFLAPWSVQGRIWPVGADRRQFDLAFTFSLPEGGQAERSTMHLSGLADFSGVAFPVPASSPLSEWTVNWRKTNDPAAAEAASAKTLADLRKLIE